MNKRITLAITGASGAPYALRLLACLLRADYQVFLIISSAARVVLKTEMALDWPVSGETLSASLCRHMGAKAGQVIVCGKNEWFSPVASGSAAPKQMVICPCSMGTLSAIAHGSSDSLLERAADVVLKERGQLILVPRESPLSVIHLENMLKLARLGVTIMPASPGFYHRPQRIDELVDFMVARILDHLAIEHDLMARWGYQGAPESLHE